VRKLITATFAITMMIAAASCGSDNNSSSTTTGAPTSEGVSGNTTADSTPATSGASAGGDLSESKQAVVDQTIAAAAATGITIDRDCFVAVVAQLSDEDAQLILEAGPTGDPTLSAAGAKLGSEAVKCVDTSTLPVPSDATSTT
jgi:hypothetical protein